MAQFFIHRPVFAWVVAILITLAGVIILPISAVEQYPDVAPPQVSIAATYPGANAQEIARSVTSVIEDELNGVDNLLYYSSTSSNTGKVRISATFAPGTDPDVAQMQVQNSVQSVTSSLPDNVVRMGLRYDKAAAGGHLLFISLNSKDGRYSRSDLADYIRRNMQNDLTRLDGVGGMDVFASERALRIWLDNAKMISLGVTAEDVNNALRAQNVQIPSGTLGAPPTPDAVTNAMLLSFNGQLTQPAEFEKIVIKYQPDGSIVHLKDVGSVELGDKGYIFSSKVNGVPSATIGISLQSGANAVTTEHLVREKLDELAQFFPDGVEYSIPYNNVPYINQSIDQLIHTLVEAIVLVFIVMFIFLQNYRYTIIPAIVVPVALLGALAVLHGLNYSINTLTMFAMVLAIGILVDDAIVVVENVERLMAEEGLTPLQATIKGMPQIQGAIVGITAVLIVVFLPLLFMTGSAGVIYRQFAVAIMVSIAFSAFLALSLTPALCATMLKPLKEDHHDKKGFFGWFNRNFERVTNGYMRIVDKFIKGSWLVMGVYVLLSALAVFLFVKLPSSFLPTEDQGFAIASIQLPSGSTVHRTDAVLKEVEDYFLKQPSVEGTISVRGFSFMGEGYNAGTVFVPLKDFSERDPVTQSAGAIATKATGTLMYNIPDATIFSVVPPPIRSLGNASGFELKLQDRGTLGVEGLTQQANMLIAKANQGGIIQNARINGLKPTPGYQITIDRDKASRFGVDMAEAAQIISTNFGGNFVNKFPNTGRMQEVWVQAKPDNRISIDNVLDVKIPSHLPLKPGEAQKFVEVRSFVTVKPTLQDSVIDRFNGYNTISIQGNPAPGYSDGEAMDELRRIITQDLSNEVGYEWAGLSYQQIQAGNQAPIMMGLAILVVFLLLAALYESWAIPFAAILIIPLGMLGVAVFTAIKGMSNDIYFQIGMITVIGLATKNAILIVEFAKDEVAKGGELVASTIDAARIRFRPILMTSFAFIVGALPLLFANAAGAAAQRAVGTAVVGGMVGSTIFSVFFVPVFFVVVLKLFKTKPKLLGASAEEHAASSHEFAHGTPGHSSVGGQWDGSHTHDSASSAGRTETFSDHHRDAGASSDTFSDELLDEASSRNNKNSDFDKE